MTAWIEVHEEMLVAQRLNKVFLKNGRQLMNLEPVTQKMTGDSCEVMAPKLSEVLENTVMCLRVIMDRVWICNWIY
jgi:hypothetical protein